MKNRKNVRFEALTMYRIGTDGDIRPAPNRYTFLYYQRKLQLKRRGICIGTEHE